VPGSFNTKRGGRYPVTLESFSDAVYTVEELSDLWPALPESTPATERHTLKLDWQAVNGCLERIDLLLDQDGIPGRFTQDAKSRKVLQAAKKAIPDDTSAVRLIVAHGLIMHGYPDDAAAALLWHLTDWRNYRKRKGIPWLQADIERCIQHARNE